MRRLLVAVAVAAILVVVASPALAGSDVATRITVQADATTVNGDPVAVHVKMQDAEGKPVSGRLLRLTVPVEFMGATKNEIVDEAQTDDAGEAVLTFSTSQAGSVEATVSYWGDSGYAPSEAKVAFDVRRPAVTYHKAAAGLQAWWARAYFILIPPAIVWVVYLLVLALVVRIRRAGRTEPPERAVTS